MYGNCFLFFEPINEEQTTKLEMFMGEKGVSYGKGVDSCFIPKVLCLLRFIFKVETKKEYHLITYHLIDHLTTYHDLIDHLTHCIVTGLILINSTLSSISSTDYLWGDQRERKRNYDWSSYHLIDQSSPTSLPIERYICNFINEIPSPQPGLIRMRW